MKKKMNNTMNGLLGNNNKSLLSILFVLISSMTLQAQSTRLVCDFKTHVYQDENYEYVEAVELTTGFEFTAGETARSFSIDNADNNPNLTESDQLEVCARTAARVPFGMTTIYVKKEAVQDEAELENLTEEELVTVRSYVDGLGRMLQETVQEGSPQKQDMIQPYVYDEYGRVERSLMGYTGNTADASFHPEALTEQIDFFENNLERVEDSDKPFAEVFYEPSPLNRAIEAGATGEQWQLENGNIQEGHIETNVANEVQFWGEDGNGGFISTGFYPPNTLIKSLYTDEQGNSIFSYTDPFGLVVYTVAEESGEGEATRFAKTYNIYDDFLRLVHVVSPEGVEEMIRTNEFRVQSTIGEVEDNWVNSYDYDRRHRIVESRIQGAELSEVVYDRYNRVNLYRNAEQRAINEWSFIKYDYLGRSVTNGTHDRNFSPLSREELFSSITNLYQTQEDWIAFETKTAENVATYTIGNSFPTINVEVLNTIFYDDLDFNNDGEDDDTFDVTILGNDEVEDQTLARVTGTKTRILGTNDELQKTIFYDEYLRVMQVKENNELNLQVQDLVEIRYNLEYEPAETAEYRSVEGNEVLIRTRNEYDHLSRPTKMFLANELYIIPDGGLPTSFDLPELQICEYEYNELGMVIEKNLNKKADGSFLQSLDYSYNIRGWMTSINNSTLTNDNQTNNDDNDLFGFELLYSNTLEGQTRDAAPGSTPRFDGLLSGVKWQTRHTSVSTNPQRERSYNYQYDKLNRLTDAQYTAKANDNSWTAEVGAYSTGYSYDLNGNLKSLFRFAQPNANAPRELIDDLIYTYEGNGRSQGNQLQEVSDQSPSLSRDQGYRQEGATPATYTYNQNGNITFDAHRRVALQYNQFLNLNTRVEKTATEYIDYTLDATGTRLAKKVVESGEITRHLHYIGSCVYDFTTLQYYLFAEGRARVVNEEFALEYHIKDHLGNARVMFEEDAQGEAVVTQENHYYPYGMRMEGVVNNQAIPTDVNTWLFNGQEFQDELGLNWYAYSLRCIDPAVGRWFEQDPYNQFFSPYEGIADNPVNFIDPTGGLAHQSLGTSQQMQTTDNTSGGGKKKKKKQDPNDYNLGATDNGDGKKYYNFDTSGGSEDTPGQEGLSEEGGAPGDSMKKILAGSGYGYAGAPGGVDIVSARELSIIEELEEEIYKPLSEQNYDQSLVVGKFVGRAAFDIYYLIVGETPAGLSR